MINQNNNIKYAFRLQGTEMLRSWPGRTAQCLYYRTVSVLCSHLSPSTLSSRDLIFAFSFATTHISFLYNKSKLINWVVCSSANSVPWVNKAKNEYCNLTSSIWTYRRRKEKTTNIKTFLFLSSTFAEKIVCVNFFCCFSASIFVLGLRSKLKSLIFSII